MPCECSFLMPSFKETQKQNKPNYFSGEQERLIHEINSCSGVWYALRCQICLLWEEKKRQSAHLVCRRQWGRKEWKSRNEREHHCISCLGQILDTVFGKKGGNKIMVYFWGEDDLKTCSRSEMCSHVLNLKEDCLKMIIIFYSILVFTDDLHHFKGQALASSFSFWIICLYNFYNPVHEWYTVKT